MPNDPRLFTKSSTLAAYITVIRYSGIKISSRFLLAVLLLTAVSVSWTGESQTIDQWGAAHYENFGKAEGRTLPASGNYGDYVRGYADLLEAYSLKVSSENRDQSFHSCSYAKRTLTCSGAEGGILSCGLVGRNNVACAIEGIHGENFNTCVLIGRGYSCLGNKGGTLNCKLVGRAVLCNYKSRQ